MSTLRTILIAIRDGGGPVRGAVLDEWPLQRLIEEGWVTCRGIRIRLTQQARTLLSETEKTA